jgi:hypothetical protein
VSCPAVALLTNPTAGALSSEHFGVTEARSSVADRDLVSGRHALKV